MSSAIVSNNITLGEDMKLLSAILRKNSIFIYVMTLFLGVLGCGSILFCWSSLSFFARVCVVLGFSTGSFLGIGIGWAAMNMHVRYYENNFLNKYQKNKH